jgi:hypothetical protein
MRSMGEGHRRVLLTFWRGYNVTIITAQLKPLPFRRGGTSPPDWSERLHGVGVGSIALRNAERPHPLPLP